MRGFDLGQVSREKQQLKSIDSGRPAIGLYTDFRIYLREFFEYKKRSQSTRVRAYSYAAFSAAADIKSPNYLKLIIDGQRNLSDEMINKFSKAMAHSKSEMIEFKALVHYGQAKDPLERNQNLRILADLRVKHKLKSGEIDADIWDSVPSWVGWVIKALIDQKGVSFKEEDIRETLKGRASTDEIRRTLSKFISDGDLVQNYADGTLEKGQQSAPAGAIPVELVRKLQAELIYLGLESLAQDNPADREFGTFTMALTEKEFDSLKFEIRQLRRRWYKEFALARETTKGDRVFQLNIQLFPMTDATPLKES
ncbi:TIGR02147 family protein [Bdellovibrionales bacterium]|nr:TIGR02147 family protein [Bdellovibrionales bacterium]